MIISMRTNFRCALSIYFKRLGIVCKSVIVDFALYVPGVSLLITLEN